MGPSRQIGVSKNRGKHPKMDGWKSWKTLWTNGMIWGENSYFLKHPNASLQWGPAEWYCSKSSLQVERWLSREHVSHGAIAHVIRMTWGKHVQKCSEDYSFSTFSLANVPIRTWKSAPKTTVFQHFHWQMCFSPQRRTIIRHRNVQKCSEDYSFLTFSLPNVLFATAAYNFSTSELQKVVPHRQFFNIFTSKCAFHHSGVQFLDIWTSKSPPGPSVF